MPGGEDSDGLPDAQEDDGELEDAPGNAGGDPSEADKKDSEDVGVDPENRDYWTFNGDVLVRHHVSPRLTLFDISKHSTEDLPIPLKYIDVMRRTSTDSEAAGETLIEDFWQNCETSLTMPWKGKTIFTILRPKAKRGYIWVEGEERRKKKTTRPGNIMPETWEGMGTKVKNDAIEE